MTPAEIEKLLADASLSLEIDNDVVCYKTQWIIDLARLAIDQARELAAKDARIAELEKPVEVKALVWRQPADERGYIALCAVGQYAVFDEGSPRWAFSQRGGYTYFYAETFENAKAAAQADYERRIRAALKEQQP